MFFLTAIILTLSGIGGAGGITLAAKSVADSLEAASTNRYVREKNERNLLRLEACSKLLGEALDSLGKQRMTIAKNFGVFIEAFEKIHNRPEFSQGEDVEFPAFDFDEIKGISVIAETILGSAGGAVAGSVFSAAAASGITSAVTALGKASTGIALAELHGAAKTKAVLAALGGGAKAAGGGGVALGAIVLNTATAGFFALVEGIAMAYAASVARKEADKAKAAVDENERTIQTAIDMQLSITGSINKLRSVSVSICNGIYKKLVYEFKDVVERKGDWNEFSDEEKKLAENCILVVQILHYLNNIAPYRVKKYNEKGEIEVVEPNTEEVSEALAKANKTIKNIE